MVELKNHQQQETEGKLQLHSHLSTDIFESSHLEDSYVGNLLYILSLRAFTPELEISGHLCLSPEQTEVIIKEKKQACGLFSQSFSLK